MRILATIIFCKALAHTVFTQEIDDSVERLNQTGAEYLQNVMVQLQQERDEGQSVEIMELTNLINMDRVSETVPLNNDPRTKAKLTANAITAPTPNPPLLDAELRPLSAPPPALTTEELRAIYSAAITKGAALNPGKLNHVQAAPSSVNDNVVNPISQGVVGDSFPGYYYYYYPIKSFMTPQQQLQSNNIMSPASPAPPPVKPMPLMENEKKAMEPLFMAITGFIGMALMFILSVLFFPKFGNIRSGDLPELKEAPNDIAVVGKLIFESLDGKDCTERIACEVGRIVRTMKMEKIFKVMEIMLPPNISRQIGLIRSAAVKKEKCNFIPCRFKTARPPSKTDDHSKPWKKDPSPHDLWMKRFEKQKNTGGQPSSLWKNETMTSSRLRRIVE